MIRHLIQSINNKLRHKALVLMYHRVAELESDVWRLAVSPLHFEQQLQILSNNWHVIPLTELADDLIKNRLKGTSIAVTFDDGYADNYLIAKPLLEKYQIPATFFISSGNLGQQKEFWWDELERIFLFAEDLPRTLEIQIEDSSIDFKLEQEQCLTEDIKCKHRLWKAFEQDPPTLRCALFLKVWETLKPLSFQDQQKYVDQIKNWAGTNFTSRALYYSMDIKQLQDLGQNNLFTVGSHTVSHPDLASLSALAQQQEIAENKAFLEKILGRKVNLLAYPYGSHNEATISVAARANFTAAVTTKHRLVKSSSNRFTMGRFLVDNWSGEQLDQFIKARLKS